MASGGQHDDDDVIDLSGDDHHQQATTNSTNNNNANNSTRGNGAAANGTAFNDALARYQAISAQLIESGDDDDDHRMAAMLHGHDDDDDDFDDDNEEEMLTEQYFADIVEQMQNRGHRRRRRLQHVFADSDEDMFYDSDDAGVLTDHLQELEFMKTILQTDILASVADLQNEIVLESKQKQAAAAKKKKAAKKKNTTVGGEAGASSSSSGSGSGSGETSNEALDVEQLDTAEVEAATVADQDNVEEVEAPLPQPVAKLTQLGAKFPLDILQKICEFLTGNWVVRSVMPTCKAFYNAFNGNIENNFNEAMWQLKFNREFATRRQRRIANGKASAISKSYHYYHPLSGLSPFCFWGAAPRLKDSISAYLSHKRCYIILFASRLTSRCIFCYKKHSELTIGSSSDWSICRKCESGNDSPLLQKNEVKRKYCLKDTEIQRLKQIHESGSNGYNHYGGIMLGYTAPGGELYLREEIEAFIKQNWPNAEQELASRKKHFTTFDAQLMKQQLANRSTFFTKLAAKMKRDAPNIPEHNIPIILEHRFTYDPVKHTLENMDTFIEKDDQIQQMIKFWDLQYAYHSKMRNAYDKSLVESINGLEAKLFATNSKTSASSASASSSSASSAATATAEAIIKESSVHFETHSNNAMMIEPIYHTHLPRSLPQADRAEKDTVLYYERLARQFARDIEAHKYADAQIAILTKGKYKSCTALFTLAKNEIESACNQSRHMVEIENETPEKLVARMNESIKRALEYNEKEEAIAHHLGALGMSYKFMPHHKEVTDYVKGKSDLTFHQVLLKVVRDACNPLNDGTNHSIIFLRHQVPREQKKIAQMMFLQLFGPEAVQNKAALKEVQTRIQAQQTLLEQIQQHQEQEALQEQKPTKAKAKQRASTSGASSSSASTPVPSGNAVKDVFTRRVAAKPHKMRAVVTNILERAPTGLLHPLCARLFPKAVSAAQMKQQQQQQNGSKRSTANSVDEMDE